MIQTDLDLLKGIIFCLSSRRMHQVTDSPIDLIHCILSCFGHWILEFEIYL